MSFRSAAVLSLESAHRAAPRSTPSWRSTILEIRRSLRWSHSTGRDARSRMDTARHVIAVVCIGEHFASRMVHGHTLTIRKRAFSRSAGCNLGTSLQHGRAKYRSTSHQSPSTSLDKLEINRSG